MGDWLLLSDEERMEGVESLIKAVVPIVVVTGAQNSMSSAAFADPAKRICAHGLNDNSTGFF